MEVYFFKQTVLLFAIKLILCSLFTFLICKLHPPVPWLLTIGKTAPSCFQFEYSLPYLDDPNLSPLTGLSRQPWVTGRAQLVHQHRPQPEPARAACLAPPLAFSFPQSFFLRQSVGRGSVAAGRIRNSGIHSMLSESPSGKTENFRHSEKQGRRLWRLTLSWYCMKNDLTLLLEAPGGGGAAKGRDHWEWWREK